MLKSLNRVRFSYGRLALVGDAAHVVHPLAGQGLNIGMYDAAGLVDSLLSSAELGEDIGASPKPTCAHLHTLADFATRELLQRIFVVDRWLCCAIPLRAATAARKHSGSGGVACDAAPHAFGRPTGHRSSISW